MQAIKDSPFNLFMQGVGQNMALCALPATKTSDFIIAFAVCFFLLLFFLSLFIFLFFVSFFSPFSSCFLLLSVLFKLRMCVIYSESDEPQSALQPLLIFVGYTYSRVGLCCSVPAVVYHLRLWVTCVYMCVVFVFKCCLCFLTGVCYNWLCVHVCVCVCYRERSRDSTTTEQHRTGGKTDHTKQLIWLLSSKPRFLYL